MAVKKFIALVFAVLSGGYLLLGPLPDPLPFLDEGMALLVFVKSLAVLGVDLSRFLPLAGKKAKPAGKKDGRVIDV